MRVLTSFAKISIAFSIFMISNRYSVITRMLVPLEYCWKLNKHKIKRHNSESESE